MHVWLVTYYNYNNEDYDILGIYSKPENAYNDIKRHAQDNDFTVTDNDLPFSVYESPYILQFEWMDYTFEEMPVK